MFIFDQLRSKDIPIKVIVLFILCCFLVLAAKLWELQVSAVVSFQNRQENQSVRAIRLPATRGKILDRNKKPLAVNRLRFDIHIYIDELRPLFREHYFNLKKGRKMNRPEQLRLGKEARYQVVSNLTMQVSMRIGEPRVLDVNRFHEHYERRLYIPLPVIQDLSPNQVAKFVELIHDLPGVGLSVNPVRTYPNGEMAFHALGYLRRDDNHEDDREVPFSYRYRMPDYVGIDGLEGIYDRVLRGEAGAKAIRVNNISYRTSEDIWEWPESGRDIELSINREIQLAAEEALKSNGPETRGSIIVMDPNNGDLLALVSTPSFDSNKFISGFSREEISQLNDSQLNRWINRASGSGNVAYPPGSIFKIISSIAYLEEGVINNPNKEIYNKGFFRNEQLYPNYSLDDTAPPGDYDFVRAFKLSCNSYFIHFALTPDGRTDQWRQGKRILIDWGNRFRLGRKTIQPLLISGDEIPSPLREGNGYFPAVGNEFKKEDQYGKKSRWAAGDVANLCIGQGEITVTPLQMAVMTAAIANGGKLIQPRLVLSISSLNEDSQSSSRKIPRKVIKNLDLKGETVSLLHQAMLADVDDRDGSGSGARVSGLSIGGKTGTAEKKVPTGKFHPKTGVRLFRMDHITWFVSFAPVESPRYAMVVMVESGSSGGKVCAPIAGRVYRAIQKIENSKNKGRAKLVNR
ncbi:MAG: penicillin-binding transpeptidase domain-containing protein [Verrucomicrobiota bacterium]|nr:penicillin-binding transpeptidase domain-containing protein [Verrucomicrobiota bacterium]